MAFLNVNKKKATYLQLLNEMLNICTFTTTRIKQMHKPGHVSYSEDFIKIISQILDPKVQNEINRVSLQKIREIFQFIVESKDNDIKSIAPSTE